MSHGSVKLRITPPFAEAEGDKGLGGGGGQGVAWQSLQHLI